MCDPSRKVEKRKRRRQTDNLDGGGGAPLSLSLWASIYLNAGEGREGVSRGEGHQIKQKYECTTDLLLAAGPDAD